MYVLATRGTSEEDFARQQLRHLAGKGIRVTERDAPKVEPVVERAASDSDGDEGDGTSELDAEGGDPATDTDDGDA